MTLFNPYIIGGTLLAFVLGVGGAYVKGQYTLQQIDTLMRQKFNGR